MRRRAFLASLGAGVVVGVAGCAGGDGSGTAPPTDTTTAPPTDTPTTTTTSKPSPTATPTPTEAPKTTRTPLPQATLEYTLTNQDDVTHDLRVAVERADGTVVEELFQPEFEPGDSVSSGGVVAKSGPYTLTFATETATNTYVWDPEECERVGVQVTITASGGFAFERDVCQ